MKLKAFGIVAVSWLALGFLGVAAGPSVGMAQGASMKGAASTPALAASSPAPLVGVEDIAIGPAQSGRATVVNVATTKTPTYHVFRLPNPPRLVVDLDGAYRRSTRTVYPAQSPYLQRVRVGRFSDQDGGIIRVVADLTGHPAYLVEPQADGLQIVLQSRRNAPPVASTRMSAEAPATAPARPSVSSAPAAGEMIAVSDPPPAQPSVRADPPAVVPPSQNDETALQARAAGVLTKDQSGLAGEIQADPQSSTPEYTGQPISLDLKDVDLKDFFRLIHQISGLNIIVDPDVTGTVTMSLEDVPWDQALALVLKQNALGEVLEGNILRIAKLSTLAAEQKQTQKLAAAKLEAAPLVTIFRPVNYAKASTIASLLKSWVGGGALTARGSVLVDDRTNTLIISDIASQIPVIESIVNKLDTKSKQVAIRARIVEVNTTYLRQLQSALEAAWTNHSGSTTTAGETGALAGAAPADVTGTGTAGSLASPNSATGFGAFVLTNIGAHYILSAALSALEEHGEARTISRPSIVTQNNVLGEVMQGAQIPIQTTINNTISVQYVNAALDLRVTPQVTEDGHIFLNINVTNNSIGPIVSSAGPSIATERATTQVLVPNGGTVVFGGVTKTQRTKNASYVPLLGSIPIIGHLFKNSTVQSTDVELLFFITPTVLTS